VLAYGAHCQGRQGLRRFSDSHGDTGNIPGRWPESAYGRPIFKGFRSLFWFVSNGAFQNESIVPK